MTTNKDAVYNERLRDNPRKDDYTNLSSQEWQQVNQFILLSLNFIML